MVGPLRASRRPTSSTAAIWWPWRRLCRVAERARATDRSSRPTVRRVPMASTSIVATRATPRWRAACGRIGAGRLGQPGRQGRPEEPADSDGRHERRCADDDGRSPATHGRRRDDQEIQHGERHGARGGHPEAQPRHGGHCGEESRGIEPDARSPHGEAVTDDLGAEQQQQGRRQGRRVVRRAHDLDADGGHADRQRELQVRVHEPLAQVEPQAREDGRHARTVRRGA